MKKDFYGFYDPSQSEIDKTWNEGIFVFDANALLNLYRYTESTRKDFLLVISKLKDKLFMPYQVGHEYHANRLFVIESLNKSYESLLSAIKDTCDKAIINTLNQYVRHPSIQVDSLKKILEDFLKKINIELERQIKSHPDFCYKDDVLTQLTELFENKVGIQFNKEELKKIYIEGKDRYEQLIPPGYKDQESKKRKGDQNVYGDLIIWKEIIAFVKKENKEIIFVTDDRKEDWWTIENGKTIRPREELIKEFYDLTGIRILIYNADNFLHFAKERKLVAKIKDKSISEVKEVRKADENYITINDYMGKSTQLYNPAGSTIADLLKTTETLRTANQWYNSTGPTIADLLKTTETLRSANQWYNPAGSTIADLLKTTETPKLNQGSVLPSDSNEETKESDDNNPKEK